MRQYLEELRNNDQLTIWGQNTEDGYTDVQIECSELIPDPCHVKVLHQDFKTRNGDSVLDALISEIEDGNIRLRKEAI